VEKIRCKYYDMRGNPISIDEVTAVPRVTVLEKSTWRRKGQNLAKRR